MGREGVHPTSKSCGRTILHKQSDAIVAGVVYKHISEQCAPSANQFPPGNKRLHLTTIGSEEDDYLDSAWSYFWLILQKILSSTCNTMGPPLLSSNFQNCNSIGLRKDHFQLGYSHNYYGTENQQRGHYSPPGWSQPSSPFLKAPLLPTPYISHQPAIPFGVPRSPPQICSPSPCQGAIPSAYGGVHQYPSPQPRPPFHVNIQLSVISEARNPFLQSVLQLNLHQKPFQQRLIKRRKKTARSNLSYEVKHVKPVVNAKPVVTTNFLEAYPTKKISEDVLQSLLPEDWSPYCVQNFNNYGVIRLPFTLTPEIFHRINLDMGGIVSSVEKVENPYQWLMYQLKRLECSWQFSSAEKGLFHGTTGTNIYPIIRDNFNYRLAGTRIGKRFGRGVNFSLDPVFCLNFARQGRCILMTRVLLGAITKGTEDTELPGPYCDSTGNGHQIVVKYHDHEFYPEYLIHVKPY